MEALKLINDLRKITLELIEEVEKFKDLPLESLNWKNESDSWSILECLEHLNLYGDFYLPEIEKRMLQSSLPETAAFNPGLLGNYFAKIMLPREPLNKMKTLSDKNPINSTLDGTCMDRFLLQQQKMLELLTIAKVKNLTKIKTSISISKWLRLRLGDTLRVVIFHNLRHIKQAKNVLAAFQP